MDDALAWGWTLRKAAGQARVGGVLYCPAAERGTHRISVNATPSAPENEAKRLRRYIETCHHEPR